jgi:hypothetical protein
VAFHQWGQLLQQHVTLCVVLRKHPAAWSTQGHGCIGSLVVSLGNAVYAVLLGMQMGALGATSLLPPLWLAGKDVTAAAPSLGAFACPGASMGCQMAVPPAEASSAGLPWELTPKCSYPAQVPMGAPAWGDASPGDHHSQ